MKSLVVLLLHRKILYLFRMYTNNKIYMKNDFIYLLYYLKFWLIQFYLHKLKNST